MKSMFLKIFVFFAFISFSVSMVYAYSEKVDVFVPSTGREVKHSSLAQKMEMLLQKQLVRKVV